MGNKKGNIATFILMCITGVLITISGIVWKQAFIHMLPLYVSLVIMLMQSTVNRFAYILGGLNSLLYAYTYFHYGLYGSAAYALLFSFPLQIVTYILWSKKKYKNSTILKKMSVKQRILLTIVCIIVWIVMYIVLSQTDSSYSVLDSTVTLLGILCSILVMLSYCEYAAISPVSGIIQIILYITMLKDKPEQMTYLVFSVYSFICVCRAFFSARKLYRQQHESEQPEAN